MSGISKGSIRAPFWVLWTLELWERFGYYGLQAILAIYFAKHLGFSDADSIDLLRNTTSDAFYF